MLLNALTALSALASFVAATPVIYDGRAPLNYTAAAIDGPQAPYVYVVRGSQNASHYVHFSKVNPSPTPLWYGKEKKWPYLPIITEQTVHVGIDNSSVFVPGGNPANAQYGFRRTEVIAQGSNRTIEEIGTTVYHFSIRKDIHQLLNPKHEYQIVFIEPNDGTHVFQIRYGTPFTIPTNPHVAKNATYLEVTDHALNVIYSVPFADLTWYNFAIQVDWTKRTLGVFASTNGNELKATTKKTFPNLSSTAGADGQGDFHFGMVKLPLADPKDTPANQGDVVHHGIQEPSVEGLYYSGVFVESTKGGVSAGYGKIIKAIPN